MQEFQLAELLDAISGRLDGDVGQRTFSRIQTDSRAVRPGDVFWALRGARHDGHVFVNQAFAAGATAAVVETRSSEANSQLQIVVPDCVRALGEFARTHRSRSDALVIGVTGSVGKTTTREMIHAVLGIRHLGIRSERNFNNQIGLPLTLLQLQPEHEFAVVEMGASCAGEIASLAATALPEVGVVTAVGAAHLEGFGNLDQVTETKGELIAALPKEGFAVLAGDDPRVAGMSRRARCAVIHAGEEPHNHVRARDVHFHNGELSFRVDAQLYRVQAAGRHHLTAAVLAIGVGREVGLTSTEIADGLRQFTAVAGRCHVRQLGRATVIDDTYNSNPQSMRAACHLLRDWQTGGRRLLVAGDMLELGGETAGWHRACGQEAGQWKFDRLLAFGQQSEHVVQGALDAGMPHGQLAQCADLESVFTVLDCWIEPDDVILVKGSRGMRMERVVEWIAQLPWLAVPACIEETYVQHARVDARACA